MSRAAGTDQTKQAMHQRWQVCANGGQGMACHAAACHWSSRPALVHSWAAVSMLMLALPNGLRCTAGPSCAARALRCLQAFRQGLLTTWDATPAPRENSVLSIALACKLLTWGAQAGSALRGGSPHCTSVAPPQHASRTRRLQVECGEEALTGHRCRREG